MVSEFLVIVIVRVYALRLQTKVLVFVDHNLTSIIGRKGMSTYSLQ